MGTSLAPSPIDKQMKTFYFLANPTTSAFYFGETLQHITDDALMPKPKNLAETKSFSIAYIKV